MHIHFCSLISWEAKNGPALRERFQQRVCESATLTLAMDELLFIIIEIEFVKLTVRERPELYSKSFS